MGRQLGADVHVVTALDPKEVKDEADQVQQLDRLRQLLETQTRGTVDSADTQVQCHAVAGEPADAITALAYEIDAPMILCGTTGKGAVARTLLGSVSHALVQKSGAIVMSVP